MSGLDTEYIHYAIVSNTLGLVACVGGILVCWHFHKTVQKHMEKDEYSTADMAYIPIIICALAAIMVGAYTVTELAKITIAPRVFLFEKAPSLTHECSS